MKVVLIEDEIAALEQLEQLLTTDCEVDIEVVERIDSVEDSIEFFRSERCEGVDLVFMDIHLSDGYSFSIFDHVEVAAPVIFTTAYDEYALKAFEVNCIDYILKPIQVKDIERIFSKIRFIAERSGPLMDNRKSIETLLVVDSWRTVPLNISDIAYFYKENNKVRAYNHEGKRFLVNMTLEKLEEQLDPTLFNRANRQFIIARSSVKDIESYEGSRALLNLVLSTPESVIISRTKVTAFKRWLRGD